jgi:predicted short-subunit dehydrogenase-like oxidoreductase (DUF2520 family)
LHDLFSSSDAPPDMDDASASKPRREVAIVGAGAVGSALARRFSEHRYAVTAILSRTREPAAALAREVGAPMGSSDWDDVPLDVPLVMLCVPDDTIRSVATSLAALPRPWSSMTVAHTSGALSADALAPLAHAGAVTLSFHPIQTFTAASTSSAFDDIYVGIEGRPEAVQFGAQLARDLGVQAVTVPTAAKGRYHLAAAIASNGLVALMGIVNEIIATTGIDIDDGAALVGPLVESTWAHVAAMSPEEALTGPAARGDVGTVAAHLETTAAHLPHLLPAYAALTNEMVRLAVRSGHLEADRADRLLDVLHDALHSNMDPTG